MHLQVLFNEIIDNLNKKYIEVCEMDKDEKLYKFTWKIGKFQNRLSLGNDKYTSNFRTLRLYAHDYSTNERMVIHDIHYKAKNPAEFLKKAYKERLFKTFITEGVSTIVIHRLNGALNQREENEG